MVRGRNGHLILEGGGKIVLDGEIIKLPPQKRDAWWSGTTRQWPFMAAFLGVRRNTAQPTR